MLCTLIHSVDSYYTNGPETARLKWHSESYHSTTWILDIILSSRIYEVHFVRVLMACTRWANSSEQLGLSVIKVTREWIESFFFFSGED